MLNPNFKENTKTTFIQQLILLDESFNLVKSDDTIFSTNSFGSTPVKIWFPFIESIHEAIRKIKIADGEIQFLRVESPSKFLPGSYDFSFSKVRIDNQNYILWSICDYTKVYTYLSKYQQLKNELDIHRQMIDYKNKQASRLNDLFS